jgi:hypothetical protein
LNSNNSEGLRKDNNIKPEILKKYESQVKEREAFEESMAQKYGQSRPQTGEGK